MSAWQPIETMPRDGTQVILYLVEPAQIPAHGGEVMSRVVLGELTGEATSLIGPYGQRATATHWMPLPDPPKDAGT